MAERLRWPHDWAVAELEDCMEAIIDYRGKTPRKTMFGIPLITAKVVKGGRIETPDEFIDPVEYDEWMRRGLPQKGDVLVTTEAPLGEVAQINNPKVALAQRLIALRGKTDTLDNSFLKFLMQSVFVQRQLLSRASGTTVSGIKQSELRKVILPLPPLKQQKAIAHILGTLDDKIELNRRMNETLEAMAQAIFQDWFSGLDAARATVADLCDEGILEIGDGYRAKNSELGAEGLPFARAGNLKAGFDLDGADHLCPASVVKATAKISEHGDVAFTSKGTVGRIARVDGSVPQFVYAPQVCFWRSKNPNKLHPAVLYCWMSSDDFAGQVRSFSGQTDMAPYISLSDQRRMLVPRFPVSQTELGNRIETLLSCKALCSSESYCVAALRDTLLPRLLSGQIVIGDLKITNSYKGGA